MLSMRLKTPAARTFERSERKDMDGCADTEVAIAHWTPQPRGPQTIFSRVTHEILECAAQSRVPSRFCNIGFVIIARLGEAMGITTELFRNESETSQFASGETVFREGE